MTATVATAQTEWKDRYVTLAAGAQNNPTIAEPAGGGYTIVVWEDYRNGESDIYAQKIDNNNGLAMWFPIDGVPVCTETGEQRNPRAAIDGDGGIIITWEDYRNDPATPFDEDFNKSEVWAIRLTPDLGTVDGHWSGGVQVAGGGEGNAERPRIAGTSDGAFITWEDSRETSCLGTTEPVIYVQYLLSADPTVLPTGNWIQGGIPVSATCDEMQQRPELVIDSMWTSPSGRCGVIVAYEWSVSGKLQMFMTRLDETGTAAWTPQDVLIATQGGEQHNVRITNASVPQQGGAPIGVVVAAWEDDRNDATADWDIYAQIVDVVNGVPQWPSVQSPSGLRVSTSNERQLKPDVVSRRGKAVVCWEQYSATSGANIWANGIDLTNQTLTDQAGVEVSVESGDQKNFSIRVVNDVPSSADVWMVWQDERHGGSNADIYYQSSTIDAFQPALQTDGFPVTLARENQTTPKLGAGVFVYADKRRTAMTDDTQEDENIYAQLPGDECDLRTGMRWKDVYAKWTPDVDAHDQRIAVDEEGSTYVVWVEDRLLDGPQIYQQGVYAQKFDRYGVPRWTNDGVYLNNTVNAVAETPDVSIAGDGSAAFVWQEGADIQFAHVDASGAIVARDQITQINDHFSQPRILCTPDRAFVPCYHEETDRIETFHRLWTTGNFLGATNVLPGGVSNPRIAPDGFDGAYVLGQDATGISCMHYSSTAAASDTKDLIFPFQQYTFDSYDVVMDASGGNATAINPYDIIVAVTDGYSVYAMKFASENNLMHSHPNVITDCVIRVGSTNSHVRLAANGIAEGDNLGGAMVVWDHYEYSAALGHSTHSIETQRVEWSGANPDIISTQWAVANPLLLTAGDVEENSQPDIAAIPNAETSLGVVTWRDTRNLWCGGGQKLVAQYIDYLDPSYLTSRLWDSIGVQVSPQSGGCQQSEPLIEAFPVSLEEDSYVTFWMDGRSASQCVVGTRFEDIMVENAHDMSIFKRHRAVDPVPNTLEVLQSYPNPLSIGTGGALTIPYSTAESGPAEVRIYDIHGRCVARQALGEIPAGSSMLSLPGSTLRNLTPGVYCYELRVGVRNASRSLILVK